MYTAEVASIFLHSLFKKYGPPLSCLLLFTQACQVPKGHNACRLQYAGRPCSIEPTAHVQGFLAAYCIVGSSGVGLCQEPGLHIVEGLDVSGGLKFAANLPNKDGEEMASIANIVQVAERVVHTEPQSCALVALQ